MDFLIGAIGDHPIVSLLGLAAIWIAFRIFRRRKIDAKFGVRVSGGREGNIIVRNGEHASRAEYEVGGKVDLIIYESSLMTADKQPLPAIRRAELLETLSSWAKARGITLDIANDA